MAKSLYVLGVFAMQLDPEATNVTFEQGRISFRSHNRPPGDEWEEEGPREFNNNVYVDVDYTVANSPDEARETGLERIRARCPEDEGWTGHSVVVREFVRWLLEETFGRIDEAEPEDEDDETPAM